MIFRLLDENTNDTYDIEIPDKTANEFMAWSETFEYETVVDGRTYKANVFADFTGDTEADFGVLDFYGRDQVLGFHSYEIEPYQFPIVLDRFRNFFKANGLL